MQDSGFTNYHKNYYVANKSRFTEALTLKKDMNHIKINGTHKIHMKMKVDSNTLTSNCNEVFHTGNLSSS